jgi:hypothetical protein
MIPSYKNPRLSAPGGSGGLNLKVGEEDEATTQQAASRAITEFNMEAIPILERFAGNVQASLWSHEIPLNGVIFARSPENTPASFLKVDAYRPCYQAIAPAHLNFLMREEFYRWMSKIDRLNFPNINWTALMFRCMCGFSPIGVSQQLSTDQPIERRIDQSDRTLAVFVRYTGIVNNYHGSSVEPGDYLYFVAKFVKDQKNPTYYFTPNRPTTSTAKRAAVVSLPFTQESLEQNDAKLNQIVDKLVAERAKVRNVLGLAPASGDEDADLGPGVEDTEIKEEEEEEEEEETGGDPPDDDKKRELREKWAIMNDHAEAFRYMAEINEKPLSPAMRKNPRVLGMYVVTSLLETLHAVENDRLPVDDTMLAFRNSLDLLNEIKELKELADQERDAIKATKEDFTKDNVGALIRGAVDSLMTLLLGKGMTEAEFNTFVGTAFVTVQSERFAQIMDTVTATIVAVNVVPSEELEALDVLRGIRAQFKLYSSDMHKYLDSSLKYRAEVDGRKARKSREFLAELETTRRDLDAMNAADVKDNEPMKIKILNRISPGEFLNIHRVAKALYDALIKQVAAAEESYNAYTPPAVAKVRRETFTGARTQMRTLGDVIARLRSEANTLRKQQQDANALTLLEAGKRNEDLRTLAEYPELKDVLLDYPTANFNKHWPLLDDQVQMIPQIVGVHCKQHLTLSQLTQRDAHGVQFMNIPMYYGQCTAPAQRKKLIADRIPRFKDRKIIATDTPITRNHLGTTDPLGEILYANVRLDT